MRKRFSRKVSIIHQTIILMLVSVLLLHATPSDNQQNKIDQTRRSSARIDPVTLGMNIEIPLGGYPGRGGTSIPLTINYSSKFWTTGTTLGFESPGGCSNPKNQCQGTTIPELTQAVFANNSLAGWTSSLKVPQVVFTEKNRDYSESGQYCSGGIVPRLHVYLPDGSTHELRRSDVQMTGALDWSGAYYAVDGSRMRYETETKTLWLPDGSRYIIYGAPGANDPNSVYDSMNEAMRDKYYLTQPADYIDRNGNKLTYNPTAKKWTDTLERAFGDPLPQGVNNHGAFSHIPNSPAEGDVVYAMPGIGTTTLQYTLKWKKLQYVFSDTNYQLNYPGNQRRAEQPNNNPYSPALFTDMVTMDPGLFNPVVLAEIVLPDGQSYKFGYNPYGEIDKITQPTGAYEKFTYGTIVPIDRQVEKKINRGVIEHRVSAKGDGTDEAVWQYAAGYATPVYPFVLPYKSTTTNPDGTVAERFVHVNFDPDTVQCGFDNALAGKVYEERLKKDNNILRRTLTEWTTSGPTPGGVATATSNPRETRETEILFEETQALTKTTAFQHDQYQNVISTSEYDFVVLNYTSAQNIEIGQIANGTLKKTTEVDYITDTAYISRQMGGLPKETKIKNASGQIVGKSEMFYDEPTYQLLSYGGTPTQWQDPQTSARGNATTTKSYSDIPSNQFVQAHAQYDIFGNLRNSWDGRSNLSQVEYSSNYNYAYPTKTISPKPDASGANGSATEFETTTEYDFNTGLPTAVTDANGQTTQNSYADPTTGAIDPLLRLRKVVASNGQQTIIEYGVPDTNGQLVAAQRFVKVKTQIDATKWKQGYTWFDGLGRTVKTQSVDSNGDVFTKTEYDLMGRVKKITNPFRGENTPDNQLDWTTTVYDDLGREKEIISPGGAKFETSYELAVNGNQIGEVEISKDEAGKLKRTITNALDHLTRVDEPNDAGQLGAIDSSNQPTIYSYDARKNLTQIVQGGQTRSFGYDSLNRLKSGTNPESGTFQYSYDANGNLETKIDARNITTTYTYDTLNRVILRDYSDATPDISYVYDNAQVANSKGKLTKVSSSVSETKYTAFDAEGRLSGSQQTTDGQTYTFGYTYNLRGDLLTQTYPSTKVVKYDYDADGDLAQVSKQSGLTEKIYADSFSYAAHGQIEKLRLGNEKWETTAFNSRLQITQIGLGHSQTDTSLWKTNYEYGDWENGAINSQKNNGNLARQTFIVPTIGQETGFTAAQIYNYDSLDRLKSAEETVDGQQKWKQTFLYDRFGNRNFDTTNNNTTLQSVESNVPKVVNPEALAIDNRYKQDQDNDGVADYLYDPSGNITKDAKERTFTYDGENRQLTAVGNGLSMSYAYDGNGKRVKSHNAVTNQTTIFVYDGDDELAAEYTINISAPTSPTISYLTEDALGSPRVITNSLGEIKARRDFLPFGEELYAGIGSRTTNQKYSSNTDDTRQKFTGYQRDAETNLDFAQSRYYSPMQGRFTSPDEFKGGPDELFDFEEDASTNPTFYADLTNPQSFNKYQYTYNNPYKYTDSSGHCPECEKPKPALIAPVISVVAAVVAAILAGPDYAVAPTGRETREENREYRSTNGGNALLNLIPIGGGGKLLQAIFKGIGGAGARTVANQAKNQVKQKIIKGYTKHGLNQAIGRNGGRGVNAKTILNTTRSPNKVKLQTRNNKQSVKFSKGSGKNKSSVVIGDTGKVITVTGKARGPQIRRQGTNRTQGSGPAQRRANKRGFSYNPNAIR